MVVLVDKKGDGTALVTLNRPEAMNALSRELRAKLAEVMTELAKDESVRAIVITGAGRAFTAGLDLKELSTGASIVGDTNAQTANANPVKAIEDCPQPIIGAINGPAVTGGFELALACDILIGSENARFADTHARVGIMPGWGLSQKLSRMIGISRAKEASLTGNYIDAQTAVAWGLMNRIVPAADLVETALKLARDIASIPNEPAQTYKRMINEGYDLPFGESMKYELRVSNERNSRVKPTDVGKVREGVMARGREQQKS
jgi:enoyl-CoA hydratase